MNIKSALQRIQEEILQSQESDKHNQWRFTKATGGEI